MSDLDLLKTRLNTAGALRVYKFGEVPKSPAAPYCVVSLDTGTPYSTRTDGRSPNTRWLLAVQLFGQSDDAVRDMAEYADEAFKDVVLTEIDGDPFSTRVLQTAIIRDPDAGGLLYALHTYRF